MIPGSAAPLLLGQTGGDTFAIERSLRFNSGDSAYLNRTPSSAGNRRTWTWSCWIKRNNLSSAQNIFVGSDNPTKNNTTFSAFYFHPDNNIYFGGWNSPYIITNAVYRDASAWYHIVLSVDTAQSTSTDRIKVYVNNVLQSYSTGAGFPGQNTDLGINQAYPHYIGGNDPSSGYASHMLADVHFIDGQALAPTDFGETDDNGVWQPKEFAGVYSDTFSSEMASISSGNVFPANGTSTINALDGSTSTALDCRRGTHSGTTSIRFTPSSAIANVTKIRVWSNFANKYEINGGGYNTFTSNGSWAEIYNGSAISLSELTVIRDSGNAGADYGHQLHAIEINDVILTRSGGNNSFYLDFADNSSNAALGTDTSGNSNTWTVNNLTALVPSTYGIDFDGNDKVVFPGTTFTGDCTIECFVKASSYSGIKRIFSANEGTNSGEYTDLRAYNGAHEFYFGTGSYVSDNGTTIPTNVWNHIALTRSGSTVSYYMNGTRLATDSLSGSVLCTSLVLAHGYGSEYFTGQISNARVVNGQALYTGASYTVPTADLTTTSQGATASNVTHLLANTSSATANGGTGSAGTAGGDPSVVSVSTFGGPADIDSLVDTPTNGTQTDTGAGGEVVGNYCTWNPLNKPSTMTLSNGNLDCQMGSPDSTQLSTIGMSSGKWYAEITGVSTTGGFYNAIGLGKEGASGYLGSNAQGWGYHQDGRKIAGGGAASYGASYAQGDVIGVAFDADNGTLTFYKNGSSQGTAYTGLTSGPYFFAVGSSQTKNVANFGQRAFVYPPNTGPVYSDNASTSGSTSTGTKANAFNGSITDYWQTSANASQTYTFSLVQTGTLEVYQSGTGTEYDIAINGGSASSMTRGASNGWETIASNASTLTSVTFTRPRGSNNQVATWAFRVNGTDILIDGLGAIKTLNTANLPTPTIADGSKYFDTKLYTGNAGTNAQTGLGFSPDLLWFKIRSQAFNHNLFDSVRGNTKHLSSNLTNAEYTESSGRGLTAFDSNGFTLGQDVQGPGSVNASGQTYVGWAWDAGTSTVTNNDGSIASQVRASAASGFSIVSYTGTGAAATFGHGLNAAPEMVIIKQRNGTGFWVVGHKDFPFTSDYYMVLNTSDAVATGASGIAWQSTAPTSSVVSIGSSSVLNGSGNTHVAYCFAPVAGYSAMGSYTGNGSTTNPPFVYLGFKPAFLVIKKTNGGAHWIINDSTRNPSNVADNILRANESGAEYVSTSVCADLLSNGFKLRSGVIDQDTNGSGGEYIYLAFASNPFQANGGLAR
jgi:hypothetical protein